MTSQTLRIALIAPLYESVPPALYGGTERVVSYLTEELVALGHQVTLFASGDSHTHAHLVSVCERALRLDPRRPEPVALHVAMLEQVFKRSAEFDVIHFHIDGFQLPLTRRYKTPALTTLHGRLDLPGLDVLYREFKEHPLVSISDAQRLPLPWANWLGTVHHGLPLNLHRPGSGQGGYLAFLGRISPEKGVDRAIEVAQRLDIPLKIAAKVDRADREYFETRIEPRIDGRLVEYLGEVNERDKSLLLGDAMAMMFLVDWPEPFGLSMIEAMACGTPIIAFGRGSVPEVISEGVSGYVVDNLNDAVRRVELTRHLSRERCRQEFERRFSAKRMALDYCTLYERIGDKSWPLRA